MPECNQIIVVEGPDGAGKSTLATLLQEHFKWPIVHGGGPLSNRLDFLGRVRTKGWNDLFPKILDRVSYISELVYAKEPLVSPNELNTWVRNIRPVLIFCCLETSEEMVERISDNFKAHKTLEQLEKVKKEHPEITRKYKAVMSPLYPINYNWVKSDFRNLITRINQQIL